MYKLLSYQNVNSIQFVHCYLIKQREGLVSTIHKSRHEYVKFHRQDKSRLFKNIYFPLPQLFIALICRITLLLYE
jgi:uncharacterized membrane protein